MAYSSIQYTGNGSQTSFTFPFGYINQTDITPSIAGVDAVSYDVTKYLGVRSVAPTVDNSGNPVVSGALYFSDMTTSMWLYNVTAWVPLGSSYVFSFIGANTVNILPPPANNLLLTIRRVTPKSTPVVDFIDGSVLQSSDLDLLAKFSLYTSQESADAEGSALAASSSVVIAEEQATIAINKAAEASASAASAANSATTASAASSGMAANVSASAANATSAAASAASVGTAATTATTQAAAAQAIANNSAISIIGSDLGGMGFAYDLGSVAESGSGVSSSGAGNIVTVATNIANVNTVATNMTAVNAAPAAATSAAASASSAATSAANANTVATSASVGIIASDLGGMGFAYDLGSVADVGSGVSSSGAGNIVTVANNISSVNTVAANISSIGAASTSATAAASSATAAATSATNALAAKVAAESARDSSVTLATSFNASATSLSAGSLATASFNPTTYKLTLGIPAGAIGATGATGAAGAAGTNGSAATIAVGTVTTGAAGSSAVITNAGTSSAAVFNFTIPRGADGSGSGTVTSVSGTAPISVATGTSTPAISIAQATTSTNGYLSSTDWNTFNGKQAALGFTPYNATNPSSYTTLAAVAAVGYSTLTGAETLTNKTITGLKETRSAIAASAIDMSAGNYFTKTISGATTFTISNTAATGSVNSFILDLTNGGSSTVTWWSGVKWAAATAPTLTASGRDVLGFFTQDGGTTWNGFVLGKAMA